MKTVFDSKRQMHVKRLSSGLIFPVYRVEADGTQVMWAKFQFSDLAEAWAKEMSMKNPEVFMLEYKAGSKIVHMAFKAGVKVGEDMPRKESEPVNPDTALGRWVYCGQHLNPHLSGWCTVNINDKVGLGDFPGDYSEQMCAAVQKCRHLGLTLYGG